MQSHTHHKQRKTRESQLCWYRKKFCWEAILLEGKHATEKEKDDTSRCATIEPPVQSEDEASEDDNRPDEDEYMKMIYDEVSEMQGDPTAPMNDKKTMKQSRDEQETRGFVSKA